MPYPPRGMDVPDQIESARMFHDGSVANNQVQYMESFKSKRGEYKERYRIAGYSPFTEIPDHVFLEMELQARKHAAHEACINLAVDPNDVNLVNDFAKRQLELAQFRGDIWAKGMQGGLLHHVTPVNGARSTISEADDCIVRLNIFKRGPGGDRAQTVHPIVFKAAKTRNIFANRAPLAEQKPPTAEDVWQLITHTEVPLERFGTGGGEFVPNHQLKSDYDSITKDIRNNEIAILSSRTPNNWLSDQWDDFGKESLQFTGERVFDSSDRFGKGKTRIRYSFSRGVDKLDKTKPWEHPVQLDKINKAFKATGEHTAYYDLLAVEVDGGSNTTEYSWTIYPYKAKMCVVSHLAYKSKHGLIGRQRDNYNYETIVENEDFLEIYYRKWFMDAWSVTRKDEMLLWGIHSDLSRAVGISKDGILGHIHDKQAYMFTSAHTVILASSMDYDPNPKKSYTTYYTIIQYTNEMLPFQPAARQDQRHLPNGTMQKEINDLKLQLGMMKGRPTKSINELIPGIVLVQNDTVDVGFCALNGLSEERLKQIKWMIHGLERNILAENFKGSNPFYTPAEDYGKSMYAALVGLYLSYMNAANDTSLKNRQYEFPGVFINFLIFVYNEEGKTGKTLDQNIGFKALRQWTDHWKGFVDSLGTQSRQVPDKEFRYEYIPSISHQNQVQSNQIKRILSEMQDRKMMEMARRELVREYERDIFIYNTSQGVIHTGEYRADHRKKGHVGTVIHSSPTPTAHPVIRKSDFPSLKRSNRSRKDSTGVEVSRGSGGSSSSGDSSSGSEDSAYSESGDSSDSESNNNEIQKRARANHNKSQVFTFPGSRGGRGGASMRGRGGAGRAGRGGSVGPSRGGYAARGGAAPRGGSRGGGHREGRDMPAHQPVFKSSGDGLEDHLTSSPTIVCYFNGGGTEFTKRVPRKDIERLKDHPLDKKSREIVVAIVNGEGARVSVDPLSFPVGDDTREESSDFRKDSDDFIPVFKAWNEDFIQYVKWDTITPFMERGQEVIKNHRRKINVRRTNGSYWVAWQKVEKTGEAPRPGRPQQEQVSEMVQLFKGPDSQNPFTVRRISVSPAYPAESKNGYTKVKVHRGGKKGGANFIAWQKNIHGK